MPANRVLHVRPAPDDSVAADSLRHQVTKIQEELQVSVDFPAEVDRAAKKAAASPRLPSRDLTGIQFVTIDPESAQDLDQALHIEPDGDGYLVRYAIADVAAFVEAGDPVDQEAWVRGQTLYGADSKIPLHPKAISEGAGSLLADQVRPAIVWSLRLDARGEVTEASVERALVRSVAKLSYERAQQSLEDGDAAESIRLLAEVGPLREQLEIERGGVSLPLPEQEVTITGEHWSLEFRSLLPVENWNAQISLMTGFAAARMMLDAGVGVLRTVPPADPRDVQRLRRVARGLRIDCPQEQDYPSFIRSLDPGRPAHAAMLVASTRLLRGSGYTAFDGDTPEQTEHSALAAPYAHVTAPLRRLVDRFGLETCLAISAGEQVPQWVRDRLADLADVMRDSGRKANQYENAILNLVEAGVLASRVGEEFPAVVVEVDEKDPTHGSITIPEPAIEASVRAERKLPLGEDVTVRLEAADPQARQVRFTLA